MQALSEFARRAGAIPSLDAQLLRRHHNEPMHVEIRVSPEVALAGRAACSRDGCFPGR